MRPFQKIVIEKIILAKQLCSLGVLNPMETAVLQLHFDTINQRLKKHYEREHLSMQRKQLKIKEN